MGGKASKTIVLIIKTYIINKTITPSQIKHIKYIIKLLGEDGLTPFNGLTDPQPTLQQTDKFTI